MFDLTVSGLLCRLIPVLVCLPVASCWPIDTGPGIKNVFTGEKFTITCRDAPTVTYADWVRVLSGEVKETELCLKDVCLNGYSRRFSVDVGENFRLTVHGVFANDSGKYTCVAIDDSENRYTTILNVIDRVTDSPGTIAVTSTSMKQTPTAATQQVTDASYTGTIAIVVIGFFVVVAVIVFLVLFVVCRRNDQYCRLWSGLDVKPPTEADCRNGEETSGKLLHADSDEIQKDSGKNEHLEETTIPELGPMSRSITQAATKDFAEGLLSIALFLKVFRKIDTGKNNVSSSATASFTLVASTSTLWWNKLIEKNVKHQIRRLFYYYRSGYGRCATCLKPLLPVSDSCPVMGMTVLNGDAYIIREHSNTVQVVQSQQTKQLIVVPGMQYPVDIVACTSSQGLYIADGHARCVWLAVINKVPVKWNEIKKHTLNALSLRGGSLLVTTNSNIIMKYSNGGERCSEIILRTDSPVEPQHAVETSASTLLVAFKEGRGCNVAEFDSNGRQLRKLVCVSVLLRFPSYIVLDSNGWLLVTDLKNNRILLVDSNMEHACAILNQQRDGIAAPRRMCLNEATGELFVVQEMAGNSGGLAAYGIKKATHAA